MLEAHNRNQEGAVPIAFALLSNEVITPKALDELLSRLKATRDKYGWVLARNGREIFIEMAKHNPSLYDDKELSNITKLLGGKTRSKVVIMFNENTDDQFEVRMARAVSKAMAEEWPILLDDGTGKLEIVDPPGTAGQR